MAKPLSLEGAAASAGAVALRGPLKRRPPQADGVGV